MLFNSLEYAILLGAVFVLYWWLARQRALRLLLLLGASYVFYAWWSAYYLILMVASGAAAYLIGRQLHRASTPGRRRAWLALGVTSNLALLGTFKYCNFFLASLGAGLERLGVHAPAWHLDLLVPVVGISFYTFEALSYLVDIYRGRLEPTDTPLEFLVFIAFFPHLVAGPILRAHDFLPQLRREPRLDAEAGGRGLFLICVGLAKKAVIADLLAVNLVDRVFDVPSRFTSPELLAGVYGYALQIYCDFSAYSDLAMGSALLLGLSLPQNFDLPYRAASLPEFWQRWHISLSTWLRDYLYLPLLGSSRARWRAVLSLFLTFLLGGLWHGPSWSFVAWGALHGVGLAVSRAWADLKGGRRPARRLVTRGLLTLATFHYVCLGWIFFRAPTFERGFEVLSGIFAGRGGTANLTPLVWGVLGAGLVTHLLPRGLVRGCERAMVALPAVAQALLLVAVVLGIRWAGTTAVVPFIYFQF